MQEAVRVLNDPTGAALALHPLRRRLLAAFRTPCSTAAAARRVGLSRQRAGYHVRRLRQAGLLEVVEERRRGNFVEQLLRSTARAWAIAPEALGELASDPEAVRDRFSADYLTASAAAVLDDLGRVRALAARQRKKVATLTLEAEVRFPTPQRQRAFARELAEAIAQLVRRYHEPRAAGGRTLRLRCFAYPPPPGGRSRASRPGHAAAAGKDTDRDHAPT